MEALIVVAVIAVILLILGMSAVSMVELLMCVMFAVTVFMFVFFSVSVIMLAMSKRHRGSFSRFEKKRRFEAAVYEIDGEEYVNRYPAETVLRDKIYTPGEGTLFLFGRGERRFVFDVHTVIIIVAGLILSAAGAALMYETLGIVNFVAAQ